MNNFKRKLIYANYMLLIFECQKPWKQFCLRSDRFINDLSMLVRCIGRRFPVADRAENVSRLAWIDKI